MAGQNEISQQVCNDLVEELEGVRRSVADASEQERREQFRRTLERRLQTLSPEAAQPLLSAVRERLVQDARGREQRLEQAEAEMARLRAEVDELKHENESLRSGAPAPAGGDADALGKLRDGLVKLTENQQVTAEAIGLPPTEARMFRLIQELFQFAIGYEMGVNLLLSEFRIGPAADMDTKMMKGFKQLVRDRFRACLDNKEGSLAALKEILTRNSRFVVDLNRAYTSCVNEGSRSLLAEIDPDPILAEHKRMMGFDYEKAWGSFARFQSELAGLTHSELWERYYSTPFRGKLTAYLEAGESK